MLRTTVVASLWLVLCVNTLHAEEPPVVAHVAAGPIRTSIANLRFEGRDHSRIFAVQHPARRNGTAQKVTAGAALGFVGLLAGGWIGAQIEGNSCHCDDPGLKGALVGAPIGAILGAITGVKLASQ